MPLTTKKTSLTKYFLIFGLVISLICAITYLYLNNSRLSLKNSFKQYASIENNNAKLDSCIVNLYKAENNCRMFVVTGDKNYFNVFNFQIKQVSNWVDEIKKEGDSDTTNNNQNFEDLIAQKKARTEQYIALRAVADNLISFSGKVQNTVSELRQPEKTFTAKQFKSIITIDTIKPEVKADTVVKKGFFKRVFGSSKTKPAEVKKVEAVTVRKEITLDTSTVSVAFNNKQLSNITNFYKKIYSNNKSLKTKEKDLLAVNEKIISNIVAMLNNYKQSEIAYTANAKKLITNNTLLAIKNNDKLSISLFVCVLALLLFIFYTLYKMYKNEKSLVKYGNDTANYALTKSRFLANMSHEIRTPLNSVIGFSEQLSQGKLDQNQTQQLEAIRGSSLILLDVVNDILDFSKYESGKVNFDKIAFLPHHAINNVINSMAILAQNKGIALKNEISFQPDVCLMGDSMRLKQVMMNLLSNAIKFTNTGSVTLKAQNISVSKKQSLLKMQIIDTGLGIPATDLATIFEEFTQVYAKSGKTKQPGTGLGLAICKKIVEFQDGEISVTSQTGKGSVFSFEIPYDNCNENKMTQVDVNSIGQHNLEGKRFLLADDNKMNILLIQTVLSKAKVITDVANNGLEAFELFEKNDYDLILTDIQMPQMGGVELTVKIRTYANKTKSSTAILGVTANVLKEDREEYLVSGMNDLVLKPFSEKELLEKIVKYVK